jgi:SET and MYND domain-containing protein 4
MKNNQLAESFGLKADECMAADQFTEALENYNQSLRYAPPKSKSLSDAFWGRSKVYFEKQQYQKCLDNIQLAADSSSCEEKCKSFTNFASECREKLSSVASADESLIALTQPAHQKVPFIADCLEVRENEIYGRFIMTTRDLIPGDVVVLEEPFYKVLGTKQRHTRCAICLRQNMLDLFPCTKCSNGESHHHFVIDRKLSARKFLRSLCFRSSSYSALFRFYF